MPTSRTTALERAGAGFIASPGDDAEDGHDAEHETSDYEPSLGSVECLPVTLAFFDGEQRRIASHNGSPESDGRKEIGTTTRATPRNLASATTTA